MYHTIVLLAHELHCSPAEVIEMAVTQLAEKHYPGRHLQLEGGRAGGKLQLFLKECTEARILYQEVLAAAFLEMHPSLSPEDAVLVENHEGNVWTWSVQAKDQGAKIPEGHSAIWPTLQPREKH